MVPGGKNIMPLLNGPQINQPAKNLAVSCIVQTGEVLLRKSMKEDVFWQRER
jgi:hypothetical protein